MPAKKKPAKKQARRWPVVVSAAKLEFATLKDELRNTAAARDQLASDLQRLLAERDQARKELAESEAAKGAALQAIGLLSTLAGRVVMDPNNLLDMAQKIVASVNAARQSWCQQAIASEQRAELAEENLKTLLAGIVTPRPSEPRCPGCDNPMAKGIHTCDRFLRGAAIPVHTPQAPPTTTLGTPGRFSREFRG